MIFSAKNEKGVCLFDLVLTGQRTVTTRYGVDAERQLKKWNAYVAAKDKFWADFRASRGMLDTSQIPRPPQICVQRKRGSKGVEYRELKNVIRRKDWDVVVRLELNRWAKQGQLYSDLVKATELEARKEGFESWPFFVKVASEFAKSKGKKFEDGVRIEFESSPVKD